MLKRSRDFSILWELSRILGEAFKVKSTPRYEQCNLSAIQHSSILSLDTHLNLEINSKR